MLRCYATVSCRACLEPAHGERRGILTARLRTLRGFGLVRRVARLRRMIRSASLGHTPEQERQREPAALLVDRTSLDAARRRSGSAPGTAGAAFRAPSSSCSTCIPRNALQRSRWTRALPSPKVWILRKRGFFVYVPVVWSYWERRVFQGPINSSVPPALSGRAAGPTDESAGLRGAFRSRRASICGHRWARVLAALAERRVQKREPLFECGRRAAASTAIAKLPCDDIPERLPAPADRLLDAHG